MTNAARRIARVRGLYEAAVAGDQEQQDAIDALIAFGADDNLRNKEGLSPAEMGIVATIETQLATA